MVSVAERFRHLPVEQVHASSNLVAHPIFWRMPCHSAVKQEPLGSDIDFCPPHHRNAKKIMEARLGVVADDIPEPEGLDQERTVER